MRQVAERAGVSAATVSLVLRGHPSISAATRERVLQVQKDLGYTVNRFAQQFVRRTRGAANRPKLDQLAFCLIGVSFDNVAYAPFLHGVVSECQTRHLQLMTRSLEASNGGVADLGAVLQDGGVDGIIVSGIVTDAVVSSLSEMTVPFVVLGNYWLRTPAVRVELDLVRVGSLVAEEVLRCGHRRIAFLAEKVENAYEVDCLRGVQARLARENLTIPPTHMISAGISYAPVRLLIEPFLRVDPLPTAIVTTDVRVADECVAELRARQIRVPEQVEIFTLAVGANERRSPLCRALNLGLERCGRMAVRRLVELVESPSTEVSATVLEAGEWLESPASIPRETAAA